MKTFACVAFALLTLAAPAWSMDKAELIQAGDHLWTQRSVSLENVERAVAMWKQAAEMDPSDSEPCYRVAMGYYFIGRFAGADEERQKEIFTQGKEWGEKAVERNPESPEAHYWLAVNMGKWGEVHGILKSLRSVGTMEEHLKEVQRLDPTYYYGGPDRVLGRILAKKPRLLGGSKTEAEEHYRKSLEIAPTYSLTLLYLAELLEDKGEEEGAKRILEKILTLDPVAPGFERELADDKRQARALLEKLK